eukprot:Em0006g275a
MWWLALVGTSLLPLVLGSFPFSSTLASNQATGQPLYQLQWTFDDVRKTITFNVVVHTTGWVGFGLSPDGGMVGSDVVIGWVSSDGRTYFHDRYAFAMATPPIDPSQDWTLLSGSESNGNTNLTFTRKWITCDSNDRDIKPDTARVVFSWGAADPADASLSGQYHGSNRGSVSLNLLGGLVNPPPQPSDAKNFTIAVNQISPKISPNNGMYVHHMLLYQCLSLNENTDLGIGYDCNMATSTIRNCRLGRPIITAWAVGGNDFIYPPGIAFPIGGRSDEQYVVMEMHYNNPSLTSGRYLWSLMRTIDGGESTYDEMCLSFPVYYPRIELGACLSLFDNTNYIPFASSNLAPADYQALVTLVQTGGSNLYSGIKSIFGTLAWTQQQQSDFQAAGPNGGFYGYCYTRNGSYLQQGNPAIAVKCAYSAPDTCQALAATTMTTTAGTAMNLPAMGGLLLTIAVIIMNFF